MILVDTCGWIEWLTEGTLADSFAPHMKDPSDLLVPTTVQYELYKWVKRESNETTAHDTIALADNSLIVPLTTEIALLAADLTLSHKLAFADAVIYASARKHNTELVTSDDHFEGQPYPKAVGIQRQKLATRIEQQGFQQVMEAAVYTWFNRFAAIRFMELHGYLDHSFRVLSPSPRGGESRGDGVLPEILDHAQNVDLPGLDKERVVELKMDGTRDEELYRDILLAQCRALHKAMPFLFERVDDETELLLPDNLLQTDSLIRELVTAIPEEDWQEIEIIGWLYQFYISEKKDQVIGKVVKSEDIPAATQLFTPNWIVKYMVQNSLGAQWLATYPDSPLKAQMDYYIEPAEQTQEVQAQLDAITPSTLNPEELTLIDPACGSGHILVEAYELFKGIYLERGYRQRDVAQLILQGSEIRT